MPRAEAAGAAGAGLPGGPQSGSGRGWEARYHEPSAQALYLHIPFCISKCAYCDFPSVAIRPGDPLVGAYIDSLLNLLGQAGEAGLLEGCVTGYIGGGTPTLAGPAIGRVAGAMRSAAPLMELTSEANPESLTREVLDALAAHGVTRISLGVQSTNNGELAALGRAHDARTALTRLEGAASRGFDTSADLMCAIPLQTEASWEKSLRDVVAAGAEHVSVYPLTIEPGTVFERRYGAQEAAWMDEDVQAARMEAAERLLHGMGFSRYEVASYSLPGHQCHHNEAYWTGRNYLGLGRGAASTLGPEAYHALQTLVPALPALPPGTARVRLVMTSSTRELAQAGRLSDLSFEGEFLGLGEALAEDLMLGMRLTCGIGDELVAPSRRALGPDVLDGAFGKAAALGLARHSPGGRLVPTHEGWLLGNELFSLLWDTAPGEVASFSAPSRGGAGHRQQGE